MGKSADAHRAVRILSSTQAESDVFHHPGGVGVFIGMRAHAGGTWSLWAQFPDGEWEDVGSGDVEFTDNSIRVLFDAPAVLSYQLRGGTQGAVAWLLSNERYP